MIGLSGNLTAIQRAESDEIIRVAIARQSATREWITIINNIHPLIHTQDLNLYMENLGHVVNGLRRK